MYYYAGSCNSQSDHLDFFFYHWRRTLSGLIGLLASNQHQIVKKGSCQSMTTFNFRCENQDSVYIIVTRIQSDHSKSFFYHQRRTLRCLIGSWWLYLTPDCQKSVMQKHDKFWFSEWESKFDNNNNNQDPIKLPRVLLLSLKKDFEGSDWILVPIICTEFWFSLGESKFVMLLHYPFLTIWC